MTHDHEDTVERLVLGSLGTAAGTRILTVVARDPALARGVAGAVHRAQFAAALNIVLQHELLTRVPSGGAYVADIEAAGGRLIFDHGALRTVDLGWGGTGALPRGELAFRRILEPLGYEDVALYPLPRLKMTGRAYRHRDLPETMPQFFVSELHIEMFDPPFAEAAARVFGTTRDPLGKLGHEALVGFAANGAVPFALAAAALPVIAAAFGRHHDRPMIDDYETLVAQSAEAGWIATEGNAFNHATDRVVDVAALADAQRALGRPMKDRVEISSSGRVRQTAYRADPVERVFGLAGGGETRRMVPGSFYEFISRDIDPATGRLDLAFDSGNATGIFAMTKAA